MVAVPRHRGPGRADRDETVITLPRSDRPLGAEDGLRLGDQIRDLALAGAAERLLVLRAAGRGHARRLPCSGWSPTTRRCAPTRPPS